MKCGDIVFVVREDLLGEAIEFFDSGDFSHCAICIDENNNILETDLFTNAQIVPFQYKDYEIVELNLTQEQRDKIHSIAQSLVGLKYNYLLIIYYVLKRIFHLKKPWTSPRKRICSELVNDVLYQIGFISKEIYESGESPNEQYKRLKIEVMKK